MEVLIAPKPSSRLTRFIWQPWRCLWAARRLKPDVIHFHDAEMLMTLPLVKLWWRHSKFVYDVHEDFANLMLVRDWLPEGLKAPVRILTNTMEKGLALLADAIVGVTPPLADKFRNKERVVAYNFVAEKFFHEAAKMSKDPRAREFDVVHLGTLNLRRADFLARTLKELHHLKPSARSVVIGVSPEIEKVIRKTIPDGCVLLGKTPHEQLPGLLGNAKVGLDVHPWLGPHLKVAIPVKVCEYMAAGCAVVSSYMPVLQGILDKADVCSADLRIIHGGEPIDYARAALEIIEMIEKGTDPGAKLQKAALQYMVWEKEADKIGQLYLRLVAKSCVV
jgi:glycosyltransferase involved in cell wall biosynthesis